MIEESRRRAYLSAMQVDCWLPRLSLPFAAPSRPDCLAEVVAAPSLTPPRPASAAPEPALPGEVLARLPLRRPAPVARAPLETPDSPPEVPVEPVARPVTPRFTLQLYRAGVCLLLVELPTGEPFQRRDPSYLLLKDLLRAAGLPDSPQLLGEPLRWPLLNSRDFDQGPQAARAVIEDLLYAQRERGEQWACLWLLGLPALRYAAGADSQDYLRELDLAQLGRAWALPGLELLIDEPQRKAALWQAMQGVQARWRDDEPG